MIEIIYYTLVNLKIFNQDYNNILKIQVRLKHIRMQKYFQRYNKRQINKFKSMFINYKM